MWLTQPVAHRVVSDFFLRLTHTGSTKLVVGSYPLLSERFHRPWVTGSWSHFLQSSNFYAGVAEERKGKERGSDGLLKEMREKKDRLCKTQQGESVNMRAEGPNTFINTTPVSFCYGHFQMWDYHRLWNHHNTSHHWVELQLLIWIEAALCNLQTFPYCLQSAKWWRAGLVFLNCDESLDKNMHKSFTFSNTVLFF